jgi:hypothetical protein
VPLALASELLFRKKTLELVLGPASRLVCWVASVALFLAERVARPLAQVS